MKTLIAFALTALIAAPASAGHRTVEFHLLEDEPASGLQPVEVNSISPKVTRYMHPEVVLVGGDIAAVSPSEEPDGRRALEITFTHDGAAKLARVTSASINKCLAMKIAAMLTPLPPH